jgi:hypothetical protein
MNITVKTPRGTFTGPLFKNEAEARANGYGIYFTDEEYEIYTKHPRDNPNRTYFAFIPYHRPTLGDIAKFSFVGLGRGITVSFN